jgi:hypothetical protein
VAQITSTTSSGASGTSSCSMRRQAWSGP